MEVSNDNVMVGWPQLSCRHRHNARHVLRSRPLAAGSDDIRDKGKPLVVETFVQILSQREDVCLVVNVLFGSIPQHVIVGKPIFFLLWNQVRPLNGVRNIGYATATGRAIIRSQGVCP